MKCSICGAEGYCEAFTTPEHMYWLCPGCGLSVALLAASKEGKTLIEAIEELIYG